MSSDELREVAGVSEWARRIRELRGEEGYRILTHADRADLKPGQYLLLDPVPFSRGFGGERAGCAKWSVAERSTACASESAQPSGTEPPAGSDRVDPAPRFPESACFGHVPRRVAAI
jgi:hypothetical protein